MFNIILKYLHSIYDKTKQNVKDLFGLAANTYQKLKDTMNEYSKQRFLETATDEWLDKHGRNAKTLRLENEEDELYRERIKDAYRGRCVTRPNIKRTIDSVIKPQECNVIKWDENPKELNEYEFAIQLPVHDFDGFFLDQSYLDQDTYTTVWQALKLLWNYKYLRELINRIKPSGSICKLLCGGEGYPVE